MTSNFYGLDGSMITVDPAVQTVTVQVRDAAEAQRVTVRLPFERAQDLANAITGTTPTPTPAPFKEDARFEDVRKGDTVRVERENNGLKFTREGVASRPVDGFRDWTTESHGYLNMDHAGAKITILSRPKPALPTEPGSVILIEINGEQVAAFRDAAQQLAWWCPVVWPGTTGQWASDYYVSALPWRLARVEAVAE